MVRVVIVYPLLFFEGKEIIAVSYLFFVIGCKVVAKNKASVIFKSDI